MNFKKNMFPITIEVGDRVAMVDFIKDRYKTTPYGIVESYDPETNKYVVFSEKMQTPSGKARIVDVPISALKFISRK